MANYPFWSAQGGYGCRATERRAWVVRSTDQGLQRMGVLDSVGEPGDLRRSASGRLPSRRRAGVADENFPIAPWVRPTSLARHLTALYRYARFVDDIGDEPSLGWDSGQRLSALDAVESQLRGLYAGQRATIPTVAALARTIAACRLPAEPLLRLIEANRIDQTATRYATFDDLVDYCTWSANPVGELVLHVFGRPSPAQVALSDRVCTALQLIEHLQDVGEDFRRDRIYLPQEDLDRFGVKLSDLGESAAGPAMRELVSFEVERAAAWLESGAFLVATLHGWGRLSVALYLAGGRAALAGLRRAADPLAPAPKPTRARIASHLLAATVRSAG
jgi:squalene synthase HpnC